MLRLSQEEEWKSIQWVAVLLCMGAVLLEVNQFVNITSVLINTSIMSREVKYKWEVCCKMSRRLPVIQLLHFLIRIEEDGIHVATSLANREKVNHHVTTRN